jgi:hypothetical protein
MSVTFDIEANPTGAFNVVCLAQDVVVATAHSYDEARALTPDHEINCRDCMDYGATVRAVVDVDVEGVNVNNANAALLLGALGYDFDPSDPWGMDSGEGFLGHVLVALAEERDESAVPAVVDARPGRSTWIECGLSEGYVGMRLGELHALALEAARLGRDITWG